MLKLISTKQLFINSTAIPLRNFFFLTADFNSRNFLAVSTILSFNKIYYFNKQNLKKTRKGVIYKRLAVIYGLQREKTVFGASDKRSLEQVSSATETS